VVEIKLAKLAASIAKEYRKTICWQQTQTIARADTNYNHLSKAVTGYVDREEVSVARKIA
jgi:hypothetical protein